MSTSQVLQSELRELDPQRWPEFLTARSGLPGPRANLTLVDAAARIADPPAIEALLVDGAEYPMMCAAAAIARRAAEPASAAQARTLATDERWRVREGVVIGLQLLGDESPDALIATVRAWADDPDLYVERAATAAICEPRLLRSAAAAAAALDICRRTTRHLTALPRERRSEPAARNLRQALGYCWSIAIAADPEPGLAAFRELSSEDPDVAWIVKENLRKKRLSSII
ncbi:HEAT repeat domain-containing protein [Microbacterium sp. SSW1-49]|uniref:HEAT repeat domain-containing protein n=1 Tax=Microbacterium croceum TaxID=2851645 RepID=A0ABT0FIH6_9MICO|nr:HEAT repeat domain-containing protein [Microbacterium croceum]MCK2037869.1 HEAT repeat domain-containing protein [Microbacterium croceum]